MHHVTVLGLSLDTVQPSPLPASLVFLVEVYVCCFSHLCSNVPAVLQTEQNRGAAVQKLHQKQGQLQDLVKLREVNKCACEQMYTHN